ncbi:MAG: hypothetical protein HKN19_04055 [Halioglobus sp.]|nr:hypothetical protein [Halioglobus sp.]
MSHHAADSDLGYRIFTGVKYLVYCLLCINVFLFLREELAALEHTFVDGIEPGQIIQVFSATIDTAAWVVLLLLFELETSVLDDSRIRGWTKAALHGVRGLCYVFIVWAFTGYYAELATLYDVAAVGVSQACELAGQGYSLLVGLDDYVSLDAQSCVGAGPELYRIASFDIVADSRNLEAVRWLAWTDVINSGNWILICVLLEIEVRLQLRGALTDTLVKFNKFVKFALYSVLFAAAAYWGVAGKFLDFWDAALWLFAFIFIELNVFAWQRETQQEAAAAV